MKTDFLDIRNMDCMELMAQYPDNHFEIAVVDPPYGIGYSLNVNQRHGNGSAKKTKFDIKSWDKEAPSFKYFQELQRVSLNQIVWGANHFIAHMPLNSPAWIVWDKNNGTTNFADAELAYTSFTKPCRIFKHTWNGMLQEDMKNKEVRIHPTQKPVALYKWIFANYAEEGMKILDTHMGSGSIAIAAHYAKMHLTACELDEDYYKAACERIERETRQIELF